MEAIEAVIRDSGSSFQDLTDEAFADLLKKHKQPVGLKAALQESVGATILPQRRGRVEAWKPRLAHAPASAVS